jgi:glutathione S-transferase
MIDAAGCSPLGKVPILVDGERKIVESGAIIDYGIGRYGNGRLAPPVDSADYDAYQMWIHCVEAREYCRSC